VNGAADNVSEAVGFTPKTALVFLIFLAAGPPLGLLIVWTTAMVLGHGQPAANYGLSLICGRSAFLRSLHILPAVCRRCSWPSWLRLLKQHHEPEWCPSGRSFWVAVHQRGLRRFHDGEKRGDASLGRVVDILRPAYRQRDTVLAGL